MGFRLKPGEHVGDEIKRIILRQLEGATSELREVGTPSGNAAVHRARRRVKKVRAAIRLLRPLLGHTFEPLDRRLRGTVHLLAPVADGQGVVEALDHLTQGNADPETIDALRAVRIGLVEREARADRRACAERVLQRVASTLRAERSEVAGWHLRAPGFKAIAEGLEAGYRGSQDAMTAALAHPTAHHFHSWRRRVKDHWFHVRLLEGRCGNRLRAYERRLEQLDECLGELHNLALLIEIVGGELSVPRNQTAARLRVIRKAQLELRRSARALALRLYKETPRHYIRRVHALWRLAGVLRTR
jgi:CHAD domain-containing protein